MRISNVLQVKGAAVATVPSSAPVSEVVHRLAHHGVGALVVSDDGAAIAGIVSERDVVRRLHELGSAVLERPVAEIMTVDVRTCGLGDLVEDLMVTMTEHRVRHVPVLDDGRIVGIVSIGDVVKVRLGELETERSTLLEYLHSGR
jgi:signal-transduction protein with cAMP-binding, CBS, and nucleotidyltransferase domain